MKVAKLPVGGRKQELIDRLNDFLATHADVTVGESDGADCASEPEVEAACNSSFSKKVSSPIATDFSSAIDATTTVNNSDGAAPAASDISAMNESFDESSLPGDTSVLEETDKHLESRSEDDLNQSQPIEEAEEADQSHSSPCSSPEASGPAYVRRETTERPDHLRFVLSIPSTELRRMQIIQLFGLHSTNYHKICLRREIQRSHFSHFSLLAFSACLQVRAVVRGRAFKW